MTELQAIVSLHEKGFDHDFVIDKEFIRCMQNNELVAPDDFEIFEVNHCICSTRSQNNSILYGVFLNNFSIKGILWSSYKTYQYGLSIHLWQKLYKKIKNTGHSQFKASAKLAQPSNYT